MLAGLYGISALWAVGWFTFHDCYYPIQKDAAKGFGTFSIKLKAAIDGWKSTNKNRV